MSVRNVLGCLIAVGLAVCVAGGLLATKAPSQEMQTAVGISVQAQAQTGAQVQAQVGVQVQMRGPVHEAFAEMVTFEPKPGVVVAKSPPAIIEELPPEQKPDGDNVVWVPGYWSWEDERSDFIWISGVWRVVPVGRQFIPGYWSEVSGGSRWTCGYWTDAQVEEVEYLSEPPKTLEIGPNTAPPSPTHIWTAGCWTWRETRYVWRPGSWVVQRPGSIWIPAHYVWAPSGFVFVGGYWDFDLPVRGVLFAPVYYQQPVYTRTDYIFSPSIVIDVRLMTDHLFLRPTYHHYYFGDYYAESYAAAGILPWFSFSFSGAVFDPIYAHYSVVHREERNWEQAVRTQFAFRREHIEARPLQAFSAQAGLAAGPEATATSGRLVLGKSLVEVAASKDSALSFKRLDETARQEFANAGKAVQSFRQERKATEAAALRGGGGPSKGAGPIKMKMAGGSPIGGKKPETGAGKGKGAVAQQPSVAGKRGPKPGDIGAAAGRAKEEPASKGGGPKVGPSKGDSRPKPSGGGPAAPKRGGGDTKDRTKDVKGGDSAKGGGGGKGKR